MRVLVLAPNEWEPLFPADGNAPAERASACVVHYLHERNIGIVPELALELARVPHGGGGAVWDVALDQVGAALAKTGIDASPSAALWRTVPLFALTSVLAAPVLRRACEGVGTTVLFGRLALSDPKLRFDRAAYGTYSKNLRQEALDLVSSPEVMGTHFWRDCAESLFGTAARLTGLEAAPGPFGPPGAMSDIDRVLHALISGLKPEFTGVGRRRSVIRSRTVRSEAELHNTKSKEGGISGFRYSRSAEDLGDLLVSEYMLPKPLLADKLLNQGVMVWHRPPMRRPRRDALIVGIVPHSDLSDTHRLVKAAWLDAAFRTAILLKQTGLGRSELRWIERSGQVGYRCARVDIQALSVPVGADPWQNDGNAVLTFLHQAHWVPGVLDRLPADTLVVSDASSGTDVDDGDPLARLMPWVRAAFARSWKARPTQPLPVSRAIGVIDLPEDEVTVPSNLSDFTSVHVHVLASDPSGPGQVFEPDWLRERARFSGALGFPGGDFRTVDLGLVPRQFERGPVQFWRHDTGKVGATEVEPVGDADRTILERRYGALIEHFVGRALDTVVGV